MTNDDIEQKIDEILEQYLDWMTGDGSAHYDEEHKDTAKWAKQQLLSLVQGEKIKELELLMARYTKIARKNTMHAISPLIIANRLSELQALKQPKEKL